MVSAGDVVELPCVARGFPLPVYAWSRDDGTPVSVATPGGAAARLTLRGGNLHMRDVRAADAGRYECEARNALGATTGSVELAVVAPLSAHVAPERQTVGGADCDCLFVCYCFTPWQQYFRYIMVVK